MANIMDLLSGGLKGAAGGRNGRTEVRVLSEAERASKIAGSKIHATLSRRIPAFIGNTANAEKLKRVIERPGPLHEVEDEPGRRRMWMLRATTSYGSPYIDDGDFGQEQMGLPPESLTKGMLHILTKSGNNQPTQHWQELSSGIRREFGQISPVDFLLACFCISAIDGEFNTFVIGGVTHVEIYIPKLKRSLLALINEDTRLCGFVRDALNSGKMDLAFMEQRCKAIEGFRFADYATDFMELFSGVNYKKVAAIIAIYEWGFLKSRAVEGIVRDVRKAKKYLGAEPNLHGGDARQMLMAVQRAQVLTMFRGPMPRKEKAKPAATGNESLPLGDAGLMSALAASATQNVAAVPAPRIVESSNSSTSSSSSSSAGFFGSSASSTSESKQTFTLEEVQAMMQEQLAMIAAEKNGKGFHNLGEAPTPFLQAPPVLTKNPLSPKSPRFNWENFVRSAQGAGMTPAQLDKLKETVGSKEPSSFFSGSLKFHYDKNGALNSSGKVVDKFLWDPVAQTVTRLAL